MSLDFGLAHGTCFDQWAIGSYAISKSFKYGHAIVILDLFHENQFLCLLVFLTIKTSGANQSQACRAIQLSLCRSTNSCQQLTHEK